MTGGAEALGEILFAKLFARRKAAGENVLLDRARDLVGRWVGLASSQERGERATIESMTAVANLSELLKVEGIDVFFIGPNDLSHTIGHPAQMHHPEVKAMVKKASAAIRAAGKIPGTLVVGETAAEFVAAGCRFLYEHANSFIVAGAVDFKRRLASEASP